MKKIFYLFAITALVFTSCQPLEDINEEIDALTANDALVGDIVYTLAGTDYTDELDLGDESLSDADQAKQLLPAFLTSKYPALGVTYNADGSIKEASSALITYTLSEPKTSVTSTEFYTVTNADYTAQGLSYPNFSSSSQVTGFLDTKYPLATDGLLVSLTYDYYSGGVSTLNNGFIYDEEKSEWNMILGLTDADYTAMGEGYPNFSSSDEGLAKIPVFLGEKYKYEVKAAGDIEGVMFKYYDGSTQTVIAYFVFDGTSWSEYTNFVTESLQFGHDGTTWVPDNTIKYTLTTADYDALGTDYGFPGYYDNFDVRDGEPNFASPESILADINTVLKNRFPGMAEEQKFAVSYAVYSGSNEVWVMNVILTGGDYVLQ